MANPEMTWRHPVRERLDAGLPVLALTITNPNAEVAAHAARLGFHLLWVEMEHSPITLESLRNILLATRGLPASIFARVPVNELWTAKRVLDQGVSGVIFPFTSTPELARQAAEACRYPPLGRRGSGAGAAIATWPGTGNYYESADSNILVVAVIEDRPGLENIDTIAATPGIDVIFVGTSDLAFSLGERGNQQSPAVRTALQRIGDAARRHGKPLGRPAVTPQQIRECLDEEFLFIQTVTELGLLTAGSRDLLKEISNAESATDLTGRGNDALQDSGLIRRRTKAADGK
jgi:2-keto-3-deoxy-L-rhamnonate aldolase RhmA